MTCDGLKNLQITYNILNLPEYISKSGTTVNYSWFADGSKYMVTSAGKGYRYTGSLIYTIDLGKLEIESTDFAGGRINLVPQDIHYFHTDHLGSVRAITNDNGETVEQNAYYPFGSRHTFGNTYAQTTNRFKFNGKEEQTSGNLGLLDYGARMYNANIGRWFVQDPLSEKYYSQSQYNYCGGNPIIRIDVDGAYWETIWDVVSLAAGVKSLINNISQGNIKAAAVDFGGIVIDAAAVLLPIPGGVGTAISATKAADDVIGAAGALNKIDNAADAGKSVDKAADLGKKAEDGNYSVYAGMDADGNVKYVGITGRNPEVRFKEHRKSKTERAELEYETIMNDLSKEQAHIQEQLLINQYGLGKDGGVLLNKINSISPNKWNQYNIK